MVFFCLDILPPIITLLPTTTTVNISLIQPTESLPALQYNVSVTRVIGERQLLCDSVVDDRSVIITPNTSLKFTNLHEFSIYIITVFITLPDYGIKSIAEFSTLPAGTYIKITYYFNFKQYYFIIAPTGPPNAVMFAMISSSVNVSWTPIDCIERNGVITNYITEFRSITNAIIPGLMMGESFIASGLTPSTNYTFTVAGNNSKGEGPFSDILVSTAGKLL